MSEKEQKNKEEKKKSSGKKVIRFGQDIEIFPDQPLKDKSTEFTRAFRARYRAGGNDLFAILCDRTYTPRASKAQAFSKILHPNLVALKASGVMYWPPDGREFYTFIYEDNLGEPLSLDDYDCALGMKADVVIPKVVKPLVRVLFELRNNDIYHGAIRPSNIFKGGSDELKNIVLGECLSYPPGLNQPSIYEPIERGLAQPSGRGTGFLQDDLYAFGVTLCFLIRRNNPLHGMTEEQILRKKMELGSYAAILGEERITGPILELLRGTLIDDPKQRWTIEELVAWDDGRRLTPKQSIKKRPANRPLHFNGAKILYPAHLAMEMAKAPNEAYKILESRELDQWLERSLTNKKMQEAVENAIESTTKGDFRTTNPNYNRMVMRVIMALDPDGPARYKGTSMLLGGVSEAITEAFGQNKDLNNFHDLFANDDFLFWISNNQDTALDIMAQITKFEALKGFVLNETPGYGLERCLYYLNTEAPCLSPVFKNHFVRKSEDFLLALEEIAKEKDRPSVILDRHMIAFLGVKEASLIENSLIDINSTVPWRRIKGTLKVLSTMQKKAEIERLQRLCAWVSDLMMPIYKRYHDRILRERMKGKVEEEAARGDLMKIYQIIDDDEIRKTDQRKFKHAMIEFKNKEQEKEDLEDALARPNLVGMHRGAEIAAFICLGLAILLIIGMSMIQYGGDTSIISRGTL